MENENTSRCKDLSKNPRRGVQMVPEHERHTIFDLLAKGCVQIHILIVRAFF